MSTAIYIGEELPDKRLKKLTKFKAYLSKEQQEEVLEQIKLHYPKGTDFNKYSISMHVDVELREYKSGEDKKSFYYEKNDT